MRPVPIVLLLGGPALAQEPPLEASDPVEEAAPGEPAPTTDPTPAPAAGEPTASETPEEGGAAARPEASDAPGGTERALRRDARDEARAARAQRIFAQRSLANHPFISPQIALSSLPTSHVGSSVGAGALLDTSEAFDGETAAALDGGLDVGVRFGRWVGLTAKLEGLVALAGDGEEPPRITGVAAWDVRAGLPVRLVHGRSTAFSLIPTGHYQRITDVDVVEGLESLSADVAAGAPFSVETATERMVVVTEGYGGLLHLALAQSAGSFFGVQLSVGGGAEQRRVRRANDNEVDVAVTRGLLEGGLALSFDANPVPLAVMLEYGPGLAFGTGPLAGELDVRHDIGAGLYLNGLTNTVGVEFISSIREGQIAIGGLVTLRAYF